MNNHRHSRRRFLKLVALGTTALASGCASARTSTEPYTKPNVVVIGAGLGGLCCGALLAKHGFSVTVLEQHHVPGGYASAFQRGRFNFEVSLHGTALDNAATTLIFDELGIRDQIELVALPEVYRLKTPHLDISVPQKDPDAFVHLLSQHFPAEKVGIQRFVDDIVAIAEGVDNLSRYRKSLFKLLTSLPYRRLWKVWNVTLGNFLEEYVKDPEVQEVLATLWGYYGLPPSKLSAFYFAVATGGYLRDGSSYIKPRSQSLSTALADVITAAGGKINYGAEVKQIAVSNGAVHGVQLADGKTVPAQVVISNANAPDMLNRMLPRKSLPTEYQEKLAQYYSPSISSFIVWLGLNQDLRDKVKAYSTFVSSGRGPEADYESYLKGEVGEGTFIVTIYDKLYDGYSEPGTSTVQLLFLSGFDPWRRFEEDYKAGRKDDYYKQKEEWMQTLLRRAEDAVIPGLSSMIETIEAATPLTNWSFTRNPEGAIYGYEQALNNTFINRIANDTPIRGLYLASAWGNPGGGYSAVLSGGYQASQKVVSDWKG